VREAVHEPSPWQRICVEVEEQSFRVWMSRQVPRLEARVEPLAEGSVVHYDVVTPLDPLLVPALFSALVFSAPVVGFVLHDALALCGYALVVPFLATLWLLVVAFSRVASRELVGLLHRAFEDAGVLDAAPGRGQDRGTGKRR